MAMTGAEEKRLINAETALNQLIRAINGIASKNQLNRLFIVYDREITRIEKLIDALETDVQEVLALARKVQ